MAQIKIDDTIVFVPDTDSPCTQWQTYFEQVKKLTGTTHARTIWLFTWQHNKSTFCTTNADFNQWLEKNGIDVSNAATRTIADIGAINSNILGVGKSITQLASIGAPLLMGSVLLVVIILLVKIAMKGKVSDLAYLHPATRSAKLLGSR